VADWKEQARNSTTFTTTKEAEPIVFKTLFDAEQHFRKTYLSQLVKSGTTLECSGAASRAGLDRHITNAVREAWEKERVFPQGLVNGLRQYFSEAGLHFFKHRKRILHVSSIKPVRHPEKQVFSDGIAAILKAVEEQPRIKRPQLATKIFGATPDAADPAVRKEQLAADLHYLLHIGFVIEFADGALDLPLSAKGETPAPPHPERKAAVTEGLSSVEPTPEVVSIESDAEAAAAPAETFTPAPPAASAPDEPEEEPVPGAEEGEAAPAEGAEVAPEPAVSAPSPTPPAKEGEAASPATP
jgi:hypothetical protein